MFTPGPRRELYELIRIHLDAGKPVDPLIIACEADLYQSLARAGDLRSASTGESLPELAMRLGALNPRRELPPSSVRRCLPVMSAPSSSAPTGRDR
jgi:hypothetical protein